MNEDIQNLREILAEMHRIGCEWYKKLCELREENANLEKNILEELRNQSKWQTNFAENLPGFTKDLLKSIDTNMKKDAAPRFQEVIDKIGSLSSIKTDMESIKTDMGSLETYLSNLPEKADLALENFRAKIVGEMGKKLDDLLKDHGDKLSKEDIAKMIKESLDNLLPDALNEFLKSLPSSVPPTAEIEPEFEPTSGETYQEPPVYESSMPDNEETPPQIPANEEISDAHEPPPEPNDNEEKLAAEQQQDVESFTPSGS